jgi:hypothetical protein
VLAEVQFDAGGIDEPEQRVDNTDASKDGEADDAGDDDTHERGDRSHRPPQQRTTNQCSDDVVVHVLDKNS